MNIKDGQKSGKNLLIRKIIFFAKSNFLLLFLVFIFSTWIIFNLKSRNEFVDIFSDSDIVYQGYVDESKKIFGIAGVIDGDSILIDGKYEVRLIDIDAPEYGQKCLDKNNKKYDCGKVSKNFLTRLIQNKKVVCIYNGKDVYNRYLAKCFLGNKDINKELIKNGMAIIYKFETVDKSFQMIEDKARLKKLGIWQGPFIEPRRFRKKYKKD